MIVIIMIVVIGYSLLQKVFTVLYTQTVITHELKVDLLNSSKPLSLPFLPLNGLKVHRGDFMLLLWRARLDAVVVLGLRSCCRVALSDGAENDAGERSLHRGCRG